MSIIHEIPNYDGVGLAELVRNKEISPQDVLDTTFFLIEKLNPSLNAIVRTMPEQAFQQARQLAAIDGCFQGVPMVLKDEYISYANTPNDHSSRIGKNFTRNYHTHLVNRYLEHGMLVIGKANLPELGASVTSDAMLYGACNNPWNTKYNSGGSSGGSACAVAAGIVPIGYANDGAGSIRIPASCCGVFGLKPTRARVSTAPDGGEYWNGLVIEHAITRSVRDSALLLDCTAGRQPGDLYCAPPKDCSYYAALNEKPGKLKIAYSAKPPIDCDIDPECIAEMEKTARLCQSLGHHVEESAPEFDGELMETCIANLLKVHLAYGIDFFSSHFNRPINRDTVEHSTLMLANQGRELSAVEFLNTLETLAQIARQTAGFFERYDLFLTPTLSKPAVLNNYIFTNDSDLERYLRRFFDFIPYTPLANVIGNPAMTVPLGMSSQNLPIGSHFIGRFGDEKTLFQLAKQLEDAAPWVERKPTVSAWTL